MLRAPSIASRLLLLAALAPLVASAQQNDIPLQRDIYIDVERNAARRDSRIHSGLKPLVESRADLTNVMGFRPDSTRHYLWITEKLFSENLIRIVKDDVRITIDPVFQFELGHDFRDPSSFTDTTRFFHNARGFLVRGDLGDKVSFQTTFYENQALFPQYIYFYGQTQEVVPGQGRRKEGPGRVYDFGWAMGNVSISPSERFNIQLGHGRHFVGHGYRSMLLSDNAFPYPYLRFQYLSKDQRLQYSTIHAKLNVLQRLPVGEAGESLFYWKRASFHHLSLDLGRLQLGLFESTIWRNIDADGVRPLDPLQYNPVMGINTLVNGFGGEHLNLVGLDLRLKLTDRMYLYGQFATDGPADERFAWQAGLRWFDVLPEFHVQLEYNRASPFTYTNTPAVQNHVHHGQALAHPLGTYFQEALLILEHRHKVRWLFQGKVNLAGLAFNGGPDVNYGASIFRNDQPITGDAGPEFRDLTFMDLNAAYVFNQMTNMRVTVGWWVRELSDAPEQTRSSYIYANFRTNLFNRYYDF